MGQHASRHAVRWADLDAYGHVSHVVALRYLQEARVDMLYVHAPAQGAEALAQGVLVVRNEIEYLRPMRRAGAPEGDQVGVRTWVHKVGGAAVTLAYDVGEGAARAATTVTPFDPESGRPRRLRPDERSVLERYLHPELALPQAREPEPTPDLPGPWRDVAVAVRFDDLDLYGHVNNVVYAQYFEEARMRLAGVGAGVPSAVGSSAADADHVGGFVVVHQALAYRRPIPFRTDPVVVRTRLLGTSPRTWTLEYVVLDPHAGTDDEDVVFATGRSTQVAYDVAARRSRALTPAERARLTSTPVGER